MTSSPEQHNPCATCGECCRSYMVPVFGQDVWLLSTRQRLSPEQFCLIYPEKEPRPEAFWLEAGGQRYSLALDKKGSFALKKACIFLMELPGGNARCGVYNDRPSVCRSYPMSLWSGVVAQRRETLCPPNSWPLAEVTHPRWAVALRRLCMVLDIYGEMVTRWNARVAAHPGYSFALLEFFSFLMNFYDRLDGLSREIGAEGMTLVEATWPNFPRPAYDEPGALEALAATGNVPWLRYFAGARRLLDSFYPDVPPQAPALRATPIIAADSALPPMESPSDEAVGAAAAV